MATYYWLGVTGGADNVMNPQNWTLWSPQGVCGYLPDAALTGPSHNDSIYYPQYSPRGELLGPTGGEIQLVNCNVVDDCPVALGLQDDYFKFNANNVDLKVGPSNQQLTNGTSYIELGKHSTASSYANVGVLAGKQHTYWIKGQIKNIGAVNVSRSGYSIVHLKDCEFAQEIAGSSNQIVMWSVVPGINSYDQFYVYDTTTGYNGIYNDTTNGVVNIYSGFSQHLSETLHVKLKGGGGVVNFLESSYTGPSGPNEISRSYIHNLVIEGTKNGPTVNINHGADIVKLSQYGGIVNFNQAPSVNSTVVQRGFMYPSNSKLNVNTPTVTIGANGDYTIFDVLDTPYVPEFKFTGNWNLTMIPGDSGICGPN